MDGKAPNRIAPERTEPDLVGRRGCFATDPAGRPQPGQLAAARAAYDQSVANYRQSVLVAFQQVEDGISNLSTLSQALATQGEAVADARGPLISRTTGMWAE